MFQPKPDYFCNQPHKLKGTRHNKWFKFMGLLLAVMPFLFALLFLPATLAHAGAGDIAGNLSGDEVDFLRPSQQASPTLQVEIIGSPWAALDSNDPDGSNGAVPRVTLVHGVITNTGGTTASAASVNLDYNSPGGWELLNNAEDPERVIGDLEPGKAYHAYWFVTYPITAGATNPYTVTATAANATTASNSATLETTSFNSTGVSQLNKSVANVVVGVAFTMTLEFDLGNSPDSATFSPAGNLDFDPAAYRLLATEVRFYNSNQTTLATSPDQIYFSTLPTPGGDNKLFAEVTFTFLALTPTNTRLCPYAGVDFDATGDGGKYDQFYCTAGATGSSVPITGSLSLSMTKQVSSAVTEQGAQLTYTIAYTNTSDQALQYVWVWDEIPTGTVSIVSGSIDPAGDPSETTNSLIAWSIGDVGAATEVGSSGTLTYTVLIDGNGQDIPDGTELINQAFLGISPGSLPTNAALTDSVATTIQAPVIAVAKTDSRVTAEPGDLLTYTLRLTNTGSVAATNLVVTDTMPGNVAPIGPTAPATDTVDGQYLIWTTLPSIPPVGGSVVITVPAQVDPGLSATTSILNWGVVEYQNGAGHVFDTETALDSTSIEIPITTLALDKMAHDVNGPPLVVGDAIRYTLVVTNTGADTAFNVTVTDNLPGGVTYVSNSADRGTTVEDNGTVTWAIPQLTAGSNNVATLLITATINEGQAGLVITNTGSVTATNVTDPPPDPDPICPDGSPEPCDPGHTPVPTTTLIIDKTAEDTDGSPLVVGDTISYTLQVTNTGSYTAYNVIVTDELPAGVSYLTDFPDQGTTDVDNGIVTWTISTLAPDGSASLIIEAIIEPEGEGQSIINVGIATGGNTPEIPPSPEICPDGSPANETGICEIVPEGPSPAPGESYIYLPIIKKDLR